MGVIWDAGGTCPAKLVADALAVSNGYTASATYTIIHRCIKKNAVERVSPGFVCRALVSRAEVQRRQTDELLDRLFDGSAEQLVASLVRRNGITPEEARRLREIVDAQFGPDE